MAEQRVRPLVNSEPVSEFGEFAEMETETGEAPDILAVPGWSDLRKRRDRELGEYARGERLGQDVSSLPVNVRWAALHAGTGVGGGLKPNPVKLMQHVNDGYRAVQATEAGKVPWLTAVPPGARIQPDGTIVNAAGDMTLVVIDAKGAHRNAQRKLRAAVAQQGAPSAMESTVREVGARGADPTMEVTKGPPMEFGK